MNGNRNFYPYVRVNPDLYEELAQEAQHEGLIPSRPKKGQNATNLGIEALIKKMLKQKREAQNA